MFTITCVYHILGMFKVKITHKGFKFKCNFFVVPGDGLALLGVPNCERLPLLSIKCMLCKCHLKGVGVSTRKK